VASKKERQRKLARAKYERQMARRAAAERRRRQIRAGVGAALSLVLIVLGAIWALGGFDKEPEPVADPDICFWHDQDATTNTNLQDVGKPPSKDLPTIGTRPMTITTNHGGPITVELDVTSAPCAAASFAHLASQNFYDNTKCHEITEEGALRCGDPSGTGLGGPTYSFYNENIPTVPEDPAPTASASPSPAPKREPLYPAGTVALIGISPGANGSQFLIFFKDYDTNEPAYPVVGKVTEGLDIVRKIGRIETVENEVGEKVKPKTDVVIESLTVGDVAEPTTTPSASPSPSDSPTAG